MLPNGEEYAAPAEEFVTATIELASAAAPTLEFEELPLGINFLTSAGSGGNRCTSSSDSSRIIIVPLGTLLLDAAGEDAASTLFNEAVTGGCGVFSNFEAGAVVVFAELLELELDELLLLDDEDPADDELLLNAALLGTTILSAAKKLRSIFKY